MAQESKQQGKVKGGEEGIVRMAGRDISGRYNIPHALMQIKGVGHNMANALALGVEKALNISRDTKIGTLSEEQLSKLEGILKDPLKVKVPSYLLNRRKEMDSGADVHLSGTDLIVKVKQDIENDIKIQTYRGFRHQYGQKVRGQKTRSTGRTGSTVGVVKKSLQPAKKGAGGNSGSSSAPAK